MNNLLKIPLLDKKQVPSITYIHISYLIIYQVEINYQTLTNTEGKIK